MEKTVTPPVRLHTCKLCEYLEPTPGAGFECRRYPPVATVVALPDQNPVTQQVSVRMTVMSARAQVKLDDFCGEFKRANHSA